MKHHPQSWSPAPARKPALPARRRGVAFGGTRAGRRAGNAGFTLLEVLAAFVVLALLTIALQRGVATAASGMSKAQARAGAELVAASLASGPLVGGSGAPEQSSGRLNGYDWTLRIETLPPDRFGGASAAGQPPSPWVPVRLLVDVKQAGSLQVLATVETIRLVRATPS